MTYGMKNEKKWIRLFQINERNFLEQQLNQFINENDVESIDVWTENDLWFAKVVYRFHEAPSYVKNED